MREHRVAVRHADDGQDLLTVDASPPPIVRAEAPTHTSGLAEKKALLFEGVFKPRQPPSGTSRRDAV